MARYTILAHAPDGVGALMVHHDQPGDAFRWVFTGAADGLTGISTLLTDPENEKVPADWVHDFPFEAEGAGPQFDTIDEVTQYLWAHVLPTAITPEGDS